MAPTYKGKKRLMLAGERKINEHNSIGGNGINQSKLSDFQHEEL